MTLDDFLGELHAVADQFSWRDIGGIRGVGRWDGSAVCCPLTAVCLVKTAEYFQPFSLSSAGTRLGMNPYDWEAVANAADTRSREPDLRQLIRVAVGLAKPAKESA